MTSSLLISYLDRDREHATILATNFPADTIDDQIRHFFKEVLPLSNWVNPQCGAIRRLNAKSDGIQEGKSFIVEFEQEVHVFSGHVTLTLVRR